MTLEKINLNNLLEVIRDNFGTQNFGDFIAHEFAYKFGLSYRESENKGKKFVLDDCNPKIVFKELIEDSYEDKKEELIKLAGYILDGATAVANPSYWDGDETRLDYYIVHLPRFDCYLSVSGYYSSWDGTDYDMLEIVYPKEVKKTGWFDWKNNELLCESELKELPAFNA